MRPESSKLSNCWIGPPRCFWTAITEAFSRVCRRALALAATDGGVNSDLLSEQPCPRECAFFFSQLILFIIINDGFLSWGFTGLWVDNFMGRGESVVSGGVGV